MKVHTCNIAMKFLLCNLIVNFAKWSGVCLYLLIVLLVSYTCWFYQYGHSTLTLSVELKKAGRGQYRKVAMHIANNTLISLQCTGAFIMFVNHRIHFCESHHH